MLTVALYFVFIVLLGILSVIAEEGYWALPKLAFESILWGGLIVGIPYSLALFLG